MKDLRPILFPITFFTVFVISLYVITKMPDNPTLAKDEVIEEISERTYEELIADDIVEIKKEDMEYTGETLTSVKVEDSNINIKINNKDLTKEESSQEYKEFVVMINKYKKLTSNLGLNHSLLLMCLSISFTAFSISAIDIFDEISSSREARKMRELEKERREVYY